MGSPPEERPASARKCSNSNCYKTATKSWSCDANPLLLSLNLPSLKSRRPYFKLLCAYKFLFNYQFCPVNVFHFHPNANIRVCRDRQLISPYARTVSYFNSYFVSTADFRTLSLLKLQASPI